MAQLIQYELDDGTTISVEAGDDDDYIGQVSKKKTKETFRLAKHLAMIEQLLLTVKDSINKAAKDVDEVVLEAGFKLAGEAGAIFAKTSTEGTLKISMKWKPGS